MYNRPGSSTQSDLHDFDSRAGVPNILSSLVADARMYEM